MTDLQIDTELASAVEQAYGLERIELAELVQKGVLSQNWFLTAGSTRYFLKRYRFDDEARIREIHAAKQFFADNGIPIILPIATIGGATYISQDKRFYALFPHISGQHLYRDHLTDTATISMAQMLARLHLAGAKSTLVVGKDSFKAWDSNGPKAQAYIDRLAAIEHPSEFDVLAREDLEMKKVLIHANPAQYEDLDLAADHLIHGDYLDHNLFFDAEEKVSHVFDLEKSQYTPRSYEFVRCLLYSVFNESFDAERMRQARLYVDAYRSVYPISDKEFRNGMELFFLKSIRNVWIQKECYDLGNRRPEQFLAPDMARTRHLAEHRSDMIEALIR